MEKALTKWFKFRPEYDNNMKIKIKQNLFERFILVQANNPFLAWSGSSWVTVTPLGYPAGPTQVSNLETYKDAILYAEQFGFEVEP